LLDLYNLATALDPALIFLTRSCPFYEGRATGLTPRTARYRGSDAFDWDGVYRDLPEVGALLPYARSPAHLVEQQFDRYRAWLAAMERAGVDLALFLDSGGDLLRPAWNPVRLNRQGTLELRGMDSNLPGTTFAAVESVSDFEVDGERLLVPGFGRLGERLFYAAVAGEADDPTITCYLDSVLDFAAGGGPRLEKLRLRRQATGLYPTTEGKILASRGPHDDRISGEEGRRLVLWACDELEGQISASEPVDGTPGIQ
jgi:carboxylate-amine ligase